ncbi:hypothetical protein ACC728_37960, partial [Rhizobium ruizarguesonis]
VAFESQDMRCQTVEEHAIVADDDGDGHVEWFEGNFEDYEQDKVRRLGTDALNPGSQAHKRLTS